jgi:hypothetical protein
LSEDEQSKGGIVNKTAIPWTEWTTNPWVGCESVSLGCANHLDDVQEAFPTRIVVSKDSDTSRIEVR